MSNELYHFGIKGQKWGIRRFQNADGSLTPAGKKRYDDSVDDSNNSEKGKFRLSDKQKKYLKVGVAVVGAGLIAYGGYKLGKSGTLSKFSNVGKKQIAGLVELPGLKLKPSKDVVRTIDVIKDDVSKINPHKNNTNCVACGVAYNLRKMGYDVTARARENGAIFNWGEVELAFEDFKLSKVKPTTSDKTQTFKELVSSLQRCGDGASGVVSGKFEDSILRHLVKQNAQFTGHAFSWEVLNGKVVFSDGQNGRIYNDASREIFAFFKNDSLEYARMDNLIIDEENLLFIKALVE